MNSFMDEPRKKTKYDSIWVIMIKRHMKYTFSFSEDNKYLKHYVILQGDSEVCMVV